MYEDASSAFVLFTLQHVMRYRFPRHLYTYTVYAQYSAQKQKPWPI